jgi:small subunit ribosomal protein S2
MALPEFNMRQLLEAGVHFGHQKHRWNPKMGSYIFGARNDIHIIDLAQTVPLLHQALKVVSESVAAGGRILFVGTKRQASQPVAEAAKRCAQYYINERWLGGTLTNWQTISKSIKRLRKVDEILDGDASGFVKKELLQLTRERNKLERSLGGIKDMGGLPSMLFVIDTNKEAIAIAEANRLNIPVAAILDSNSDPAGITYPIPGNDDAARAISFYCDLVARAAVDGLTQSQSDMGVDPGAAVEPVAEAVVAAPEPVAAPPAAEVTLEAVAAPTAAETTPEPGAEAASEPEATPAPEPDATPAPAAEPDASPDALPEVTLTEDKFVKLDGPRGEQDDLKKISGVGPVLEQKLNDLGIYHYWQIAGLTPEDITEVDDGLNFKGRIERDGWLKQAKDLIG